MVKHKLKGKNNMYIHAIHIKQQNFQIKKKFILWAALVIVSLSMQSSPLAVRDGTNKRNNN